MVYYGYCNLLTCNYTKLLSRRLIDEEAMGVLQAGKALNWTTYGQLEDVGDAI